MKQSTRENFLILTVAVIALSLLIVVVGSVVEIFDDAKSRTSMVISRYQTYLGAVVALLAAMITVVGIFVAAQLPIRDENRRAVDKRKIRAKVGAAILAAEIGGMVSGLEAQLEFIRGQQALGFSEIEVSAIPVSAQLSEMDILETQSFEFCSEITVFICAVARVNAFGRGYIVGNTKTFEDKINDAILAGNSIEVRLSEFAEKAEISI